MEGGADAVVSLQGAVWPDFVVVQARCPVVTKDKSWEELCNALQPPAPGWAAPAPPRADSPRRGLSVFLAPFRMETITWLQPMRKKTGVFHAILLLQCFPFLCRIFLAFLTRQGHPRPWSAAAVSGTSPRRWNHSSVSQLGRRGRSQEHATGAHGGPAGSAGDGLHARRWHDTGDVAQSPPNSLKLVSSFFPPTIPKSDFFCAVTFPPSSPLSCKGDSDICSIENPPSPHKS